MKHFVEILNERDRYMIGDWVYVNGKPKRWIAEDFYRSKIGMALVKPIPITAKILEDNGFVNRGKGEFCHPYIHVTYYLEKSQFCHGYMNVDAKIVITHKISYVHQLQHDLRSCELYDYEYNLNIK